MLLFQISDKEDPEEWEVASGGRALKFKRLDSCYYVGKLNEFLASFFGPAEPQPLWAFQV